MPQISPNVLLADEVEQFLDKKPNMRVVKEVFNRAFSKLLELNVEFKRPVVIKMVEDVEDPGWKGLAIEFEIEKKTYKEILDIWDEVAKHAFKDVKNPEAKKIELILKRAK